MGDEALVVITPQTRVPGLSPDLKVLVRLLSCTFTRSWNDVFSLHTLFGDHEVEFDNFCPMTEADSGDWEGNLIPLAVLWGP